MEEIRYFVSPDGCNCGDGSRQHPFRTIARGQQAARETDSPVTVEVLAGTYRESLCFDERDSGDRYLTAENALLTGGLTVPYAETSAPSPEFLARLPEEAAGKVRAIDLKQYGIAAETYEPLYPIGCYHTGHKYDGVSLGVNLEVFENDRRMTLARYPNQGYLKLDAVLDVGDAAEFPPQNYWRDWQDRRNHRPGTYILDRATNQRAKGWKEPENAWMFGYFYWDWADSSTPVAMLNTVNRAVVPRFVSRFGARADALYYFYNIPEELDVPGEYYLDRQQGILYVYAADEQSVFAVSIENKPLITLQNADSMTFEGFTLCFTLENGITVQGNDNRFADLLIKNVANHGITANGYRNTVENCEITRTGKGGILLTGGVRDTLTPGENRADNNFIHDFSEVYQTYQPAVGLYGVGNSCAHNEICRSPHMAIGYDGNEHLIEYNRIYDVVLHSSDAGAIYAGNDWAGHGTVIRWNLLQNIGGEGFRPDGIYWDDGLSGQTAYGNILIDVRKNAFLIGGGRDNIVRDNILIGESIRPILYDDRYRDGFVNDGWARAACKTPDGSHWRRLAQSPYRTPLWAEKYPSLARLSSDFSQPDSPDFAINPAGSTVENNVIINQNARIGLFAQSVYTYSTVQNNFAYHSYEEAGLDPDTFRFADRPDFPEIPFSQIGRINPKEN